MDHAVAPRAVITPLSASAAISVMLSPASRSTSTLCSPIRGGWRVSPGRRRSVPNSNRQGWQTGNFAAFFAKARDEHVYEPASRQEMRVGEQVARLTDQRPGDVAALAARGDFLLWQRREHLLQRRDQP